MRVVKDLGWKWIAQNALLSFAVAVSITLLFFALRLYEVDREDLVDPVRDPIAIVVDRHLMPTSAPYDDVFCVGCCQDIQDSADTAWANTESLSYALGACQEKKARECLP